jgi:hypothetical protein
MMKVCTVRSSFGFGSLFDSLFTQGQTTVITWPPTIAENTTENNRESRASHPLASVSDSRLRLSLYETQNTQETASYNYSDASSIGRFPSFNFSLHSLTSLAILSALSRSGKGSCKVSILAAVFEVEGPDTITIKKGMDAGKQISLLKMILGDEGGDVCKLTAWRDVADSWGGNLTAPAVKKGDICFVESMSLALRLLSIILIVLYRCDGILGTSNRCLTNSISIPHVEARYLLSHNAIHSRRQTSQTRSASWI